MTIWKNTMFLAVFKAANHAVKVYIEIMYIHALFDKFYQKCLIL